MSLSALKLTLAEDEHEDGRSGAPGLRYAEQGQQWRTRRLPGRTQRGTPSPLSSTRAIDEEEEVKSPTVSSVHYDCVILEQDKLEVTLPCLTSAAESATEDSDNLELVT